MNKEKLLSSVLKIKNDLLKNKRLAAFAAAALICMIAIAFSETGSVKEETYTENSEIESSFSQQQLQKELTDFLENISGAGEVEVMITYESSTENVYACDTDENSDIATDSKEERNSKSEHIIIKNGDGESGLTVKEIYPKVRGVAVICDGGNDPVVKGQIISMISALFDINSTKISVAAKAG